MSFAERNKIWLLPLLAAGVAAVLWYDLRDTGTPATAVPSAPPQAAVPDASAPPSSSAAQPTAAPDAGAAVMPPLGPDAWADLRPMNTVPAFLNQLSGLTTQATRALPRDLLDPPPPGAMGNQALATPDLLSIPSVGGSGPASEPPTLEFISRTPEGLHAWYGGVAFKAGQTILGTTYRIREIRPPKVVLEGPSGRIEQATFRLAPPVAASHPPELP